MTDSSSMLNEALEPLVDSGALVDRARQQHGNAEPLETELRIASKRAQRRVAQERREEERRQQQAMFQTHSVSMLPGYGVDDSYGIELLQRKEAQDAERLERYTAEELADV